ncbi:hypothetical protein PAXINDRAFT_95170 [Paxillus involutus ATCC 200175]|nr:hypothetical protein PAXINDRAFT_95170 [Paxillus involutus ATCC 200175]
MSLRRILNDEPPPPRSANPRPSRGSGIDTSLADMSPISVPPTMSPARPRTHHRSQSPPGEQPPPPRGYTYQPVSYHGAGGWDPYSGNYVQGDIFPLGPGGNYYPQRELDSISSGPPEPPESTSSAYYKEGENEHASKKRRKAVDDDPDYRPPITKRPGLRRNPPRTKAPRQETSADGPDVSPAVAEYHQTEEERRLVSSDLSDCEDVWIGELSDYIIETHKRQRQVESWFEASVLERNSTTAVALSRHYVARIARIPPPPSPPPMPPASVDEDLLSTLHPSPLLHAALVDYTGDSHEYDRDPRGRSFNAGAEDAARELEESLLGSRSKNKRKDPLKRPANDAVSDASSDLEIPIPAARKDKPANKKRKVDKDASAIADEFERAVNESSASPVKPSKAKGKGKVPQLREPSVESTATLPLTPKGRKKAAAKKKFDGLHPDATGLGSATGSVAGDATPSASRPASPALTTTSTVVYELDEVVPPLKRAKKRQVESWFEASVLERNSTTAVALSRHYVARIARIPPPPSPPPMPPASVDEDLLSTLHPSPLLHAALVDYTGDSHEYDRDPRGRSFNAGAEDAARELEESLLGSRSKNKRKDPLKRPANDAVSDASSDLEIPIPAARKDKPANKKRKVDKDASAIADEFERAVNESSASPVKPSKAKGKGKVPQLREPSVESTATLPLTPKGRKKAAAKKKFDGLHPDATGLGSATGSVAGDATPSASRPASPALTTTSTVVYELDEVVPPLKRAKKVDDSAKAKRLKALEEAQRKVWTNIARRDVAKVYKYAAMGYQARQSQLKRLAMLSSMQARRPFTRTAKANKDVQAKAKRLMREMLVFWKKNEREERDVRKREQKEAIDRARIEEEKREAARQARKLEFLISQTELYSHFVGNKLKTAEVQGEASGLSTAPAGADMTDVDPTTLREIDFDDEDQTNLHRHARHNAQEAIALARERAQQFDTQAALERKTNEAMKLAKAQAHIRDDDGSTTSGAPLMDLDSDELNFQNPTSLTGPLTIKQPRMLMAQLKEYQLKGLNWLGTLYEQGINGILADEMGLGKTVQSISLLAYLAEVHDIWGPFLVVAPASTLHNWQQEITRFVPSLKALPYWGNVKDRTTLRKFWSKKEISYDKDAPFHVLITSYQLVTQDQQYFQRVKWQYMVLDEAQNIKNASSVRWKTLLGFQCRNRLLLTGTPIQNSMQELWALLHFIMPSLFDSHDEFNEWFSKDIENAAENKGSKLNEHQLRRLHMILKPFMLRRVKRHVQNELSEKIEIDIYVDLSSRQRALYRALLANVSVADLLEKAANIGDADSARSLMNLVMQFRKVCNHPELFERADVVAPFSFAHFGRSGPLNREGDLISVPYSTRNPIEYCIPELFYLEGGLVDIPSEKPGLRSRRLSPRNLFNIWSPDWIYKSMYDEIEGSPAFAFLRLLNKTPGEVHGLQVSSFMRNRLVELQEENMIIEKSAVLRETSFDASDISFSRFALLSHQLHNLPDLLEISSSAWQESCLCRPGLRWFVPAAVAPPMAMTCTDRTFVEHQTRVLEAPMESIAVYGLPRELRESTEACSLYNDLVPMIPCGGLIDGSPSDQLPSSSIQIPEGEKA